MFIWLGNVTCGSDTQAGGYDGVRGASQEDTGELGDEGGERAGVAQLC
jgi:hypothetical protein